MAVTRLTGLSSGFDYESIIKDLMKTESTKINKLKQQKQLNVWKQEAFREINTKLLTLKTEAFNLKLSSSYKAFNTTVDSEDSNYVRVTSTNTAVEGSYSIKVRQLATTSQKASASTVSPLLKSTTDITDFNVSGKDLYITFDGTQKHISWSASEVPYTTIGELKAGLQAKINDAFGSNQITVDTDIAYPNRIILNPTNSTFKPNIAVSSGTTSDALVNLQMTSGMQSHISLNTQLEDIAFTNGTLTFDTDDKLKFTINGSSFAIDRTSTLQTLITTVNADANADVTMSYDSAKDLISIKRKSSGAGKDIVLSDGAGSNFSTAVGFGATVAGQNALIDFTDSNGVTTTDLEKASNTFSLAGLSISLLKVDTVNNKTVTVSKDVDKVFDTIKNFIDKYNETIELLNTKTSEKRYYDYEPLTDEQKEAMSDTQIEEWETKAKSGLANGDTMLSGLITELRNALNNSIPGLSSSFDQLKEFGITTGGFTEKGKLYIDETKLRQVISENPEEVTQFFSTTPTNITGSILSGNIDVEGKDFKITLNGQEETITLSGTYDLATAQGKAGLIEEINDKLETSIGTNQVIATLSSDNRLIFSSPSGNTFKFNSGTVDALSSLGISNNSTYDATTKGVIAKLYDKLSNGISKIIKKAGNNTSALTYYDSSVIGQEILRIDLRITQENTRLTKVEDRYYKKFTAMETALNKMNAQSSWLSQQTSSSS